MLGNYQGAKPSQPGGDQKNKGGELAIIQRGTRGRMVSGDSSDGAQDGSGEKDASVSTMSTQSGVQTNNAGESHYFYCGEEGHWARECPFLSAEQQQEQLHMTLEGQERVEQEEETAHQFFHMRKG